MDNAQWPQEILVTNTCSKPPQAAMGSEVAAGGGGGERKSRPKKDQALNCPRCNSTNTKFCYYNNYSLTQPRYFCKTCRRYWTDGGSLRSIPVGGGSRKNKRSNSHSSNNNTNFNIPSDSAQSPAPKKHLSEHHLTSMTHHGLTGQNPKFHETQDLNLGFPHGFRGSFTELIQNIGNSTDKNNNSNPLLVSPCSATSAGMATSLDLLNSSNGSSDSFMGLPSHRQDPSGFSMQDHYKSTTLLGFSLDNGVQDEYTENGERLSFPFEALKLPISSSSQSISPNKTLINEINDQKQGDNAAASSGYWTGMLSGGSW